MVGSVSIHNNMYKECTTWDIPIANVLIKCRRSFKHASLYMEIKRSGIRFHKFCIHSYTYKLKTIRHIPITNVLIKWQCFIKHVILHMKIIKSGNNRLWVTWVLLDLYMATFKFKNILTKYIPLETSQLPMFWLNADAS